MQYSSELLLNELLNDLERQPPCESRDQAYAALQQCWLQINERAGMPATQIAHIRRRAMCSEHGWENLQADPCYIDSFLAPATRVNLHANGAIVIQRMDSSRHEVLFAQPGKTHGFMAAMRTSATAALQA
nr:hypothetical protein [Comamonas testosteroni]